MGEHLLCKQKVVGSIPIASTIAFTEAEAIAGGPPRFSKADWRRHRRRPGLRATRGLEFFYIVNMCADLRRFLESIRSCLGDHSFDRELKSVRAVWVFPCAWM